MGWILYVLFPVLLHLLISELTAILAGSVLDSAACTALSAVLILPAAVWMYRRDAALPVRVNASKNSLHLRALFVPALLLCFALGGLLNAAWSEILYLLHISEVFSNQTQEALFDSAFLMQILGPGLFVPIAEEMIFRGLTYTRMRMKLSVWQAVLLSSLLFALYHGNIIQIIYAFPMALILALLYEKSGSLLYPISFHMGANLTALLVSLLQGL